MGGFIDPGTLTKIKAKIHRNQRTPTVDLKLLKKVSSQRYE